MLKGKKIALRALEPEDLDFLFTTENNTDLWYVSDTTIPYSRDVLRKYLDNAHQDLFEAGQYRFVITHEDKAVGFIDLFSYDALNKRAGVGILIASKEHRGQGWGTEALKLLTNYAHEVWQVHQLYAHIEMTNTSSINTFEKAGFKIAGTLKDWNYSKGNFHDVYLLQWLES